MVIGVVPVVVDKVVAGSSHSSKVTCSIATFAAEWSGVGGGIGDIGDIGGIGGIENIECIECIDCIECIKCI